jgi:hypothetical protein
MREYWNRCTKEGGGFGRDDTVVQSGNDGTPVGY